MIPVMSFTVRLLIKCVSHAQIAILHHATGANRFVPIHGGRLAGRFTTESWSLGSGESAQ